MAVEYNRKIDWQINGNVKVELVKRYLDTNQLKISTTKGVCDIGGKIELTGQAGKDADPTTLMLLLKKLELALRSVPFLKAVRWSIDGWQRQGTQWQYTPTATMKKTEEERKHKRLKSPGTVSGR